MGLGPRLQLVAPQQWAFEQGGRDAGTGAPATRAPGDDGETTKGARRAKLCATCRYRITTADARTTAEGRHSHSFVNPHGFAFHIGCFSHASGCRASGTPTSEFTWFRGFKWQRASCRRCGGHLGWRFQGDGRIFFGLILDRLVDAQEMPEN